MWLVPAAALVGLVLLAPLLRTLALSTTDRSLFGAGEFVGIGNYALLGESELFWRSLRNNLLLLLSVPLVLGISVAITGALLRGLRGSRVYETLIFLPYLPAVASVGTIFIYLLAPFGPINQVLAGVGLEEWTRSWLTDSETALWTILAVMSWKRLGLTVLLLMAAATQTEEDTVDAAFIDGAGWWQAFLRVVLPQMRGMVTFAGLIGVIEVFSYTFGFVFVLTRGGPNRATYTLDFMLYETQFLGQLVGLACAIAVVLVAIAAAFAVYRVRMHGESGMVRT